MAYLLFSVFSSAFLRAAGANPRSKGQNLQSYAIMPVQRVPRYLLLLRELIKWTSDSHPDRVNLDLALNHVDESAKHMNAAIQVTQYCFVLAQPKSAKNM